MRDVLKHHREQRLHEKDAAEFFWWNKPQLLLNLFQYSYFENSFSIAMAGYAFTQGLDRKWMFEGTTLAAAIILLVVDVLLIMHSAWCVLPLYALIMPLGSHCPAKVIKRAIKSGFAPKQAQALARMLNVKLADYETWVCPITLCCLSRSVTI